MDLNKLSSQDLDSLFQVGCFFVLNDLPVGTQFAIDGSSWLTGPLFQGVKLIPPGFHIITISPAPTKLPHNLGSSSSSQETFSAPGIGYQVKKGLIRFFKRQEKVIRHFDATLEDFKTTHDAAEHTITSLDYMKTIDSKLAPYPMKDYDRWRALTNYVTTEQVSKIIGFDNQEDALLDSLISNNVSLSSHPPPPLSNSLPNRTQWGKPRTQKDELQVDTNQHPQSQFKERTTSWPFIDLKRSWPKDALGPELTKWSRDKSWLFNHLMYHQFNNDPKEVLGLLQLSFVTFIEIQSIQSFEFYQSLMNLIVKANLSELLELSKPSSDHQDSSSRTSIIEEKKINYLSLNLDIIKVFSVQLKFLKSNFFSESMEDFQIENWFFGVVDRFRMNLNFITHFLIKDSHDLFKQSVGETVDNDKDYERRKRGNEELQKSLEGIDWPGMQADCKRFDWNVKDLKIPITQLGNPNLSEIQDLLVEDCEDDDEEDETSDEEEEEFKPVLVTTYP
ncbi:hypothetical protein PTTG_08131 [Puccinia triticina 1-1 BBBD Race 1]|uniref:Uncharacterized protein n=2 Tax=Puccinia triticina TaxID=208348 RepID=A0A0C4F4U1_PUCT1|nr:uncharacterized protein PtA15_7A797 [Puccinia triticina]OAV91838.1 hypothetical protein PTTG_08131 [Puccinia triticina 1-1 BBBD Race 1]WAQ87067.1 hypothetical protein PtA15_7A797 [Puccinia triticina]WAR56921.1 hypothetical protein PtB15_7B774 [Puccinia triticina]